MQLSVFSAVIGHGEHHAHAAGAALAPMLSLEHAGCEGWASKEAPSCLGSSYLIPVPLSLHAMPWDPRATKIVGCKWFL